MVFVHAMLSTQEQLTNLGHTVVIPIGSEPHLTEQSLSDNLQADLQFCIKENIMKRNFDQLATCDAILVLNKKRNGIKGYIGISALMEMAIAYYLNKKIFLLNNIPSHNEHRWAQEVGIIQPTILHGNLSKIV